MRLTLIALTFVVSANAALADLAPDPADPTSPTGALVWVAIAAAVCALILIWRRRR
jgi:hypothetical protein